MAAKPFLDWSLVWGLLLSILTNLLGNITIHDIGESGSQPTSMKGRSRILIVVHMKLGVGQRINAHRCRPANPTKKLLVPFMRTANQYDSHTLSKHLLHVCCEKILRIVCFAFTSKHRHEYQGQTQMIHTRDAVPFVIGMSAHWGPTYRHSIN